MVRTRKRFGQNFLIDEGVIDRIVSVVGLSDSDRVLEIGPGYGRFSRMFLSWRLNFYLDLLPQCESKIKKLFHPPQYKYIRFYTTDRTTCRDIPTNSCNFVFSWDTFTFFTQIHIERYLRDIHRVILPGGYCFIHYADCQFDFDLHFVIYFLHRR